MHVSKPLPSSASYLVPLSGPELEAIELKPKPGGAILGRHEQCDISLPSDAEKVSRFHARFTHDGSRWHVSDLTSRWGTFVNGMKLTPQSDVLLSDGDLIRITPWTFTLSSTANRRGLQASDDLAQTMVKTVHGDTTRPMADTILTLLLECAGAIHAAGDEMLLGELILDAAVRGTGLQNAAVLRPLDSEGHFEILASRFPPEAQLQGTPTFSRSLIAAASQGVVAEVNASSGPPADISQSMVQLKISSAICVPLMLGATVAAYLYLDSRGTVASSIRPGASAFCVALGKMASLALSNQKRVEMERREADLRAELAAAAAAQKWILPPRQGRFGPFSLIGESRAGKYVGGDFFDIIPLSAGRLAVALGDVSGKGVGASVLMTAAQGYLHAALRDIDNPGTAVTELNRFVNPRRPEHKFVTLWVGVFDAEAGTLSYVDAGHSYALLHRADGSCDQLDQGGGPPIGVDETAVYQAEVVKLGLGDRVLIVSDGIIEQSSPIQASSGPAVAGVFEPVDRQQFEMSGVREAISRAGADEVADLFRAVTRHAGSEQLSDDATAVLVRWG